jgi:hypothetical protein
MADKKSFVLRIDPKVFEALQRISAAEFRSVNGQIEFILSDYLRRRGALKQSDFHLLDPEDEAEQETSAAADC